MTRRFLALLPALLLAGAALASDQHHHQHHSSYAGLEDREIKTLSQDDIDELRGYTNAHDDPCDGVPEGHDPERYRQHMGCD